MDLPVTGPGNRRMDKGQAVFDKARSVWTSWQLRTFAQPLFA